MVSLGVTLIFRRFKAACACVAISLPVDAISFAPGIRSSPDGSTEALALSWSGRCLSCLRCLSGFRCLSRLRSRSGFRSLSGFRRRGYRGYWRLRGGQWFSATLHSGDVSAIDENLSHTRVDVIIVRTISTGGKVWSHPLAALWCAVALHVEAAHPNPSEEGRFTGVELEIGQLEFVFNAIGTIIRWCPRT